MVNMHQGNAINPWINYPYETVELMKEAGEACHKLGVKFKIYNTMRELSNRCREVWALRALRETYVTGVPAAGGVAVDVNRGADWLQEHLQSNYEVAWSNPVVNQYPGSTESDTPRLANWADHANEQDAAIKVKALSRWNNYYVEGIRQMIADFGFDGLYLDEIAYDRVTMLRAKTVLGADRLIDHHSDQGGFTPSPAANYLELYPFIDSLWYGEGFDYDHVSPSYWLAEMSGIPHGLNADLLRYAGQTPAHFKGMLVGSGNRWQESLSGPPDGNPFDPRNLWKLWDSFGIEHAVMFGWWLDGERGAGTVPVVASNSSVKVTTYVRKGVSALVAVASFLDVDVDVTLSLDWAALGLDRGLELRAPQIIPFQPNATSFPATKPFTVRHGQGWIFLLG